VSRIYLFSQDALDFRCAKTGVCCHQWGIVVRRDEYFQLLAHTGEEGLEVTKEDFEDDL